MCQFQLSFGYCSDTRTKLVRERPKVEPPNYLCSTLQTKRIRQLTMNHAKDDWAKTPISSPIACRSANSSNCESTSRLQASNTTAEEGYCTQLREQEGCEGASETAPHGQSGIRQESAETFRSCTRAGMDRTILRKMRSGESSWRQSRKVIIEKAQVGLGTAVSFLHQNHLARSSNEERGSYRMGCGIRLAKDGSSRANSLEFGITEANRTYRRASERDPCAL